MKKKEEIKELKLKLMGAENELKECKEKIDSYFDSSPTVNTKDGRQATIEDLKEPFKREVGKVYKDGGGLVMCTRIIGDVADRDFDFEGYGFGIDGVWRENLEGWIKSMWQEEATDKEWLDALTKEAERRGYKEGVKFKFEGELEAEAYSDECFSNVKNCLCIMTELYTGDIIMKDGVWAEIIPEKKVLFESGDVVRCLDKDQLILVDEVTDTSFGGYVVEAFNRKEYKPCLVTKNYVKADSLTYLYDSKKKKVLFTTEDGVDMYENCEGYATEDSFIVTTCTTHIAENDKSKFNGRARQSKYFYHKKNAIAYIKERDKPKYNVINSGMSATKINDSCIGEGFMYKFEVFSKESTDLLNLSDKIDKALNE